MSNTTAQHRTTDLPSVGVRLEVNALLERILYDDPGSFSSADARRLIELVPGQRRFGFFHRLGLTFGASAHTDGGPSLEGLTNAGSVQDSRERQTRRWSSEPTPVRAGHFKVLHDAADRELVFWHFMESKHDLDTQRFRIRYSRKQAPLALEREATHPITLRVLRGVIQLSLVDWKQTKSPV